MDSFFVSVLHRYTLLPSYYITSTLNPPTTLIFLWYILHSSEFSVVVVMGTAAPFLGLVISLLGALCVSALAIIFPAMADVCVNWEDRKGGACLVIRNVMIILFGIGGLIAGTYASVHGIIIESMKDSEDQQKKQITH